MRVKIKRIICHIIFLISCLAIFYPRNYKFSDWEYWITVLGVFGIYFTGKYEERNGY